MAQITIPKSQVAVPDAPSAPLVRGSAVQFPDFGKALSGIAEMLIEDQEKEQAARDNAFATERLAQAQVFIAETLETSKDKMGTGGDGYASAVEGTLRQHFSELSESTPSFVSQPARDKLKVSINELMTLAMGKARLIELGEQKAWQADTLDKTLNSISRMALEDPTQVGRAVELANTQIDLTLTGNAATDKKRDTQAKIVMAGHETLIGEGRYKEAEALLNSEAGSVLTPGEVTGRRDRAEVIRGRLKREANQRKSEARAAVLQVQDRLSAGYAIPAEELAGVEARVQVAGDAEATKGWSMLKRINQDVRNWQLMTPQDLLAKINADYAPATRDNGATEWEAVRLETARNVLSAKAHAVSADPVGYAQSNGYIDVDPIDTNDPDSIGLRSREARGLVETVGNTAFFTESEAAQEAANLRGMSPAEIIEYGARLKAGAGPMFEIAVQQLAGKGSDRAIYTMALGSAGAEQARTAQEAMIGLQFLDENPAFKPLPADIDPAFAELAEEYGLRELPPVEVAQIKEHALGLYYRMGGTRDDFDDRLFAHAVRRAVGGLEADDETGLIEINGQGFIAPPGVSESAFTSLLETRDDAFWENVSLNGSGPHDASGRPVSARDIAEEGQFIAIGPDTYSVLIDGYVVLDAENRAFVVRLPVSLFEGVEKAAPSMLSPLMGGF